MSKSEAQKVSVDPEPIRYLIAHALVVAGRPAPRGGRPTPATVSRDRLRAAAVLCSRVLADAERAASREPARAPEILAGEPTSPRRADTMVNNPHPQPTKVDP